MKYVFPKRTSGMGDKVLDLESGDQSWKLSDVGASLVMAVGFSIFMRGVVWWGRERKLSFTLLGWAAEVQEIKIAKDRLTGEKAVYERM